MKRLKELRDEKKITQVNLAIKLEASQQTISRLEREPDALPSGELAVKMSKLFNVSVDYLFELSNIKRKQKDEKYSSKRIPQNCVALIEVCRDLNEHQIRTVTAVAKGLLEQEK